MKSTSYITLSSTSLGLTAPKQVERFDPSLAIMVGLGAAIVLISIYKGKGNKSGKTATARWANPGEIDNCNKAAKAAIAKPRFNKAAYYITEPLGGAPSDPSKTNSRVMFPQINRSLLVVGGAGSGKTASVINPALMSAIAQGHSIALYDYKFGADGQAEVLLPLALKHGYQIRVFAPGRDCSQVFNILDLVGHGLAKFGHIEDPHERNKAVLLEDSKDLAGAKEIIAVISDNTGEWDAKKDNFFDPASVSVLSGAVIAAKWAASEIGDPSLANILMVSQILSLPNLTERLIANRSRMPAWIFDGFKVLTSGYKPDSKGSAESGILMTCQKTLAPVTLPNYLPAFCGTSNFPNFDPLDPLKVDGKQIIVFGVNKDTKNSTIPLVATCIDKIISRNLRPGRTTPMVVAIDEFSTLKLNVVLDWLNQERFNGASLILGIQYLGQIESKYGREWSKGILASCATKTWFNPGENETAEYVSKSLGERELDLETKSRTINSGAQGGSSNQTSNQLHRVPLMAAHEIRQFPPGYCIIESPGVSNSKQAGIPYTHQFKFDEDKSDKFKVKSRTRFKEIIEMLEAAQSDTVRTDYSEEMGRYSELLEKLLPLEPGTTGKASKPKKDRLTGKEIIKQFSKSGDNLADLKIDPDQIYIIPPEFIDNGKITLKKTDLPNIISSQAKQPNTPF